MTSHSVLLSRRRHLHLHPRVVRTHRPRHGRRRGSESHRSTDRGRQDRHLRQTKLDPCKTGYRQRSSPHLPPRSRRPPRMLLPKSPRPDSNSARWSLHLAPPLQMRNWSRTDSHRHRRVALSIRRASRMLARKAFSHADHLRRCRHRVRLDLRSHPTRLPPVRLRCGRRRVRAPAHSRRTGRRWSGRLWYRRRSSGSRVH